MKIYLWLYTRFWGILGTLFMDNPEWVLETEKTEHWRPFVIRVAKIKVWLKKSLTFSR